MCGEKSYSGFSNGSEDFHFLFNSSLDCIEARCKKLTWVISFTLSFGLDNGTQIKFDEEGEYLSEIDRLNELFNVIL